MSLPEALIFDLREDEPLGVDQVYGRRKLRRNRIFNKVNR